MEVRLQNYLVEIKQSEEFNDLKREIFNHQIYYFETDEPKPIIIDGGAHVGLATLYFKWLYPQSQIIAFEPNPQLFQLLEKNVGQNDLQDVTLVNKALGKHEDQAKFYIDETNWQWYSTGSMYKGAWTGEQKTKEITVLTTRLDSYLKDLPRVDLLKLDIEGKEMQVILSLKDQLSKVRNLIFEFHPTRDQRLSELLSFLQKRGYQTRLKDRKNQTLKVYHERELVIVECSAQNGRAN